MKILVIFTCPFCNDGISNNIMNYFTYMNHDIIQADFVANNSDVPQKWIDKITSFGGKLYIIENRNSKPLQYVRKLSKLIKLNKYDIVHAHGNSATLYTEMYAAKLGKCPIRIAHSRNTKCNHTIIDKLLRPFFYKTMTHGFACGEDAGKWLFGKKEFKVIKNGNDIKKNSFNKDMRVKYRNEFSISEDTVVLTHVGFFVEQKNHRFLIDMYKELISNTNGKYLLCLIGTGKLMDEIKQKIIDYNINDKVLILGNRDDVSNLLSMSDAFVFPSLFEGLPNALVEAQISCLNCFASDKITKEANVSNKVNYISIDEPNSIKNWVEAIKNMPIVDRNEIQDEVIFNIRNNGFDIEANAKDLENTYLSLKK